MTAHVESNGPAVWAGRDWTTMAVCIVLGMLLSAAPHIATLFRFGSWEYVADGDDIFYLALTRYSFQGEGALRDRAAGIWEHVPAVYPWLPYGPTGQLNRWLGLPLLASGVEWRLAGGLLLGGMLFLLFRTLFSQTRHPTAWAFGCAAICLSDAGFAHGATFLRSIELLADSWRGIIPFTKPDALPQLRVVSPLLMLPWLLLMVTALLPTTIGKWKWSLAGAIGLGLCCALYFYLWTAAVLGLVLYIAARLTIGWRRRDSRSGAMLASRHAAIVLAGGLALGAPQIYQTYQFSRQPQLQAGLERTCRAQHIPPSDPYRRMNLIDFWVWGKLLAGGIAILWFGFRGLGLLWWLVFAGYVLSNLGMLLGIEFENWHWAFVHRPCGEILLLGCGVFLLERLHWRPRQFVAIPALLLAIAAFWRPYEALAAPESARDNTALRELSEFRPSFAQLDAGHSLAGPSPEADIALMFSKSGGLYANYMLVGDEEIHERFALNAWLLGVSAEQMRTSSLAPFTPCDLVKPAWDAEVVRKHRADLIGHFQEHAVDDATLNRYRPDYLLVPAGFQPDARIGPWRVTHQSAKWVLWERQP